MNAGILEADTFGSERTEKLVLRKTILRQSSELHYTVRAHISGTIYVNVINTRILYLIYKFFRETT